MVDMEAISAEKGGKSKVELQKCIKATNSDKQKQRN